MPDQWKKVLAIIKPIIFSIKIIDLSHTPFSTGISISWDW